MLTPKQNMLEVIKGGNPDRFVNQYEAVQFFFHPFMFANPLLQPGQENVVNALGSNQYFPERSYRVLFLYILLTRSW